MYSACALAVLRQRPQSAMGAAEPLGSGDVSLPKSVRDMLVRGRVSWLRNEDVVDLLHNYKQYKFRVSKEPPVKPPGECAIGSRKQRRCLPAINI